MTDYFTFQEGFFIMLIGIVISLVLIGFMGGFLDRTITTVDGLGFNGGLGTEWDSTGPINIMINVFYVLCAMPGLLGVAAFFLMTTKRQRYDAYTGEVYDDY